MDGTDQFLCGGKDLLDADVVHIVQQHLITGTNASGTDRSGQLSLLELSIDPSAAGKRWRTVEIISGLSFPHLVVSVCRESRSVFDVTENEWPDSANMYIRRLYFHSTTAE